jgi:hypothetical protein
MSESELEEQILEQISGVRLHRQRSFTPFAHVADEPLVDVLFSITRGTAAKQQPAPPSVAEPVEDASTESLIPKGMVNYRRERYGDFGDDRNSR